MRLRHSLAALALLTAMGGGACVTSGEGERMQADISKLRERVDAMDRRDSEINEQVSRLRSVLDEATGLLKRNSADLGTKVAKNESDLAAVTGQLEEAKHLLDELQRKVNEQQSRLGGIEPTTNKIVDTVAPAIPDDKEALWREAHARMNAGK